MDINLRTTKISQIFHMYDLMLYGKYNDDLKDLLRTVKAFGDGIWS